MIERNMSHKASRLFSDFVCSDGVAPSNTDSGGWLSPWGEGSSTNMVIHLTIVENRLLFNKFCTTDS